jgi:hypothetical protein
MRGVRGRRYLLILAVLAGLVGVYAAIGFLLVPRWTRSELVGLTSRDFGRKLSLGEVRFNPFTWTLEISDFSFPDADGRPMISFRRLEVALGIASVARLAPSFSEIVLDHPRVSVVVRPDGALNLADLEKPFAQAPAAKPPPAASKPMAVFIDRLAVENGSVAYEDDSRPTPFHLDLDPIGFELTNFSTAGKAPGTYQLAAVIGQGGRLDWTGSIRTAPLSLHGTLKLEGLSARTVGQYLGAVLPAEVSKGSIALQAAFALDSGDGAASPGIRMTIDVPQAEVTGLGVRPRQATSDYVALDRFTLGDTHIDLGQRSIRVGEITLAGGDVRGWLDPDGRLNLLELLGNSSGAGKPATLAAANGGREPPPPAGAPSAGHAAAWRIAAPDVRIEDTRLSLEDRGVKPAAELALGPLSARITGYDSTPGSRITVALQSPVNGKGALRMAAAGTLQPEALSAKVELSRIDLRVLQPYLEKYTALNLASGFLSTTLEIGQQANGSLRASGRIDIAQLRTVDDALKLDFLKWQALHIVGFQYVSRPASLRIERIIAVAPYARVIIGPQGTLNVSEALHPRGFHAQAVAEKGAQPPAPVTRPPPARSRSAPAPMPMTIGLVRIANGTADYADYSIKPNFATGIQDLHGAIKGLSSAPGSRATLNLRGTVNGHSPVDINGAINLLSAATYADVQMKFRDLELTQMTPYAVRFAGYKIASGTLDADITYKVNEGKLDAEHRFVINQLQLGEQVASPHAIKLPLRLAVALLKDRDGVIRIGLPVTGSLNDPQFSLGPLIGKALVHLLEKVVTAPFALLGRVFGGGPDVNQIEFAPGSSTLLPDARARLGSIAKALAGRPQLQLQVPAVFAPDVDRPALAERQLRDELLALARSEAATRRRRPQTPVGREVLELPLEHYRLLRTAYQNTFGSKAPLPAAAKKVPPFEPAIRQLQSALLQRMQVSNAALQALADRRAQAIRSAILATKGVDAGRVAVAAAAPQHAAGGKVTVKLGLK